MKKTNNNVASREVFRADTEISRREDKNKTLPNQCSDALSKEVTDLKEILQFIRNNIEDKVTEFKKDLQWRKKLNFKGMMLKNVTLCIKYARIQVFTDPYFSRIWAES